MPKDNYCTSEYGGSRCEDAAGHEGAHSHWIEGYGDLTWTDEQAAVEQRRVVDFWALQGISYPLALDEPHAGDSLPAAEEVQRFEDLIVRQIAAGGTYVKGLASAKQRLVRALKAREVALEASRIFQGGHAEDERDDPTAHFWRIFEDAFPDVDIQDLPPRPPHRMMQGLLAGALTR